MEAKGRNTTGSKKHCKSRKGPHFFFNYCFFSPCEFASLFPLSIFLLAPTSSFLMEDRITQVFMVLVSTRKDDSQFLISLPCLIPSLIIWLAYLMLGVSPRLKSIKGIFINFRYHAWDPFFWFSTRKQIHPHCRGTVSEWRHFQRCPFTCVPVLPQK